MNRPKLKPPRFIAYVQPGTTHEQHRRFFSIAAAQVYAVGHATRALRPGHPVRWYIVDLKTSVKVIEGLVADVERLQHVSEPVAALMKKLSK